MNTSENLELTRNTITALEADREKKLAEIDQKINEAAERNYTESHIEELRGRRASLVVAYDRAISRQKDHEADLTIRRESEVQAAAAQLGEQTKILEARLKNQAMITYTRTGGTPEEFEAAWPRLKEQILNNRVANVVGAPPAIPRIRL